MSPVASQWRFGLSSALFPVFWGLLIRSSPMLLSSPVLPFLLSFSCIMECLLYTRPGAKYPRGMAMSSGSYSLVRKTESYVWINAPNAFKDVDLVLQEDGGISSASISQRVGCCRGNTGVRMHQRVSAWPGRWRGRSGWPARRESGQQIGCHYPGSGRRLCFLSLCLQHPAQCLRTKFKG